ncbi:MAG: helix-turn-helix domain-containing protein [Oscillospiraceae bacterium]|nr:helix-turn-helix domain-containing protein [Oscillospiraceae bacterium]
MNLSISIILYELRKLFQEVDLYGKNCNLNELTLRAPVLYDGGQAFESHHIYVVDSEDLPEHPGQTEEYVIICNARPPEVYLRRATFILSKNIKCDLIKLYNRVVAIFDKYNSWDDAMKELIINDAPLTDYLRYGFSLLLNPLILYDCNYHCIARSEIAPHSKKQLQPGKDPEFYEPIPMVLTDEIISALHDSKDVNHLHITDNHREYLAVNLFDKNIVTGVLMVCNYYMPFREQDPSLVRHMTRYMNTSIRYNAYTGRNLNQLKIAILDLVNKKKFNHGERHQLSRLITSWVNGKRLYCLVVVSSLPNQFTSKLFASRLELNMPGIVAVPYESLIIALICEKAAEKRNEFFEHTESILRRLSLKAGCSNSFEDFFALSDFFEEAIAALKMGSVKNENQILFHFADYALEFFFQYGYSTIPAHLLCAGCIKRLAERDKKSAVSYCDSLRVYLETGRNLAETARRLNIQRNTFLARCERIMRYIDLDIDNPDDRLYLEISLRMLKRGVL